MPAAPAFKEWQAIVGALLSGEQILILRKGGIAEGRGGFAVQAARFWLFPTAFHAQREKTKPSVHRFFAGEPSVSPAEVTLTGFAEVSATAFLTDWKDVARLDPFHGWSEATVRERFDWASPPGVHALAVRVHRLREPRTMSLTPAMAGCKSWVDLPLDFSDVAADPVLDDASFAARLAALGPAFAPEA